MKRDSLKHSFKQHPFQHFLNIIGTRRMFCKFQSGLLNPRVSYPIFLISRRIVSGVFFRGFEVIGQSFSPPITKVFRAQSDSL